MKAEIRKKLVLLISLVGMIGMLLFPVFVFAQSTVKGVVTDAESGDTIPGVDIKIKGTITGTSTEMDGTYSLGVPSLSETLMFSFVGYKTLTFPINERITLLKCK